MKKYHKFMEYFWLVAAILTSTIAIMSWYKTGSVDTFMAILPFLTIFSYFMRKKFNQKQA